MVRRVLGQVSLRQLEKRGRWLQTVLLQMDESSRKLDETLVEISICAVSVWQPEMFEDIVRLVKFLFVEQLKVACIAGINALAGIIFS
jgi:hypothetical protein